MRKNWKNSFGSWYNDIIEKAEILDVRYPIKGDYVWLPYGFKVRKHVLKIIRTILDETGHEEALFPLLIPENEFAKEAVHIRGFEDEVYWVTHGGGEPLNVKLALRPTSETAIYPMYKLWVRSHSDFPLKTYQIVNTFRYETKHTRPLIRLREITTFKEAHAVHGSWKEAEEQIKEAIDSYSLFFNVLGVPYVVSRRPEWDKFPGAEYTMAFDTLFPDGRSLQIGTVHNLGQNFAETFEITFENIDGEQEYAYQTTYGISDRAIAALLAIHGDDKGLVLMPELAPIQVVLVPIWLKNEKVTVNQEIIKIRDELSGIRTLIDDREVRPGSKFYDWEIKGVPLRLELGPKDIEKGQAVLVRRDTGEKLFIKRDNLESEIKNLLNKISDDMREKAWEEMMSRIQYKEKIEDITRTIKEEGGIVKTYWCGEKNCGEEIEEKTDVNILGILNEKVRDKKCVGCNNDATHVIQMARTY